MTDAPLVYKPSFLQSIPHTGHTRLLADLVALISAASRTDLVSLVEDLEFQLTCVLITLLCRLLKNVPSVTRSGLWLDWEKSANVQDGSGLFKSLPSLSQTVS